MSALQKRSSQKELVSLEAKNLRDQYFIKLIRLLGFSIPFLVISGLSAMGLGLMDVHNVLAHKKEFDGQRLFVYGYLHERFEDSALYASTFNSKPNEAIWLTYRKPKPQLKVLLNSKSPKYVMVSGTFRANLKGHLGAFGGTLENVAMPILARPTSAGEETR